VPLNIHTEIVVDGSAQLRDNDADSTKTAGGADLGPDVDPFILHLFAALAQKERALISKRTTEASAKARGVTLCLLSLAA
jgi:DNA invertase Pin-like site-specific DNA recombinase